MLSFGGVVLDEFNIKNFAGKTRTALIEFKIHLISYVVLQLLLQTILSFAIMQDS